MLVTGQAVYQTINQVRIEHHEKALVPDAMLVKAAQIKANDLLKPGCFAHQAPGCKSMWSIVRALNGSPWVLGNNLAKSYKTVEDLEAAWLRSKTHKANILDRDYRKTGIGIAHAPDGTIYVVQVFSN